MDGTAALPQLPRTMRSGFCGHQTCLSDQNTGHVDHSAADQLAVDAEGDVLDVAISRVRVDPQAHPAAGICLQS